MNKKKLRGFTLIELIIVISVIAILLGIALPRLKGMIDEGNVAKAAGEIRALQVGLESYYVHQGKKYPAALATLTSVTPKLINSIPTDPFGTSSYSYAVDGAPAKFYVVWSVGIDGSGTLTISTTGLVGGAGADDIYMSNGTPSSGGF